VISSIKIFAIGNAIAKKICHICSLFYELQTKEDKMKNIKILMSQCGCNIAFAETVEKIVKESGIEASVSRIDDVVQMLPYNVMTLPALVVDERLVSTGKISEDKIKELIKGEI
jgi:hypothetical protein